MMKNLIILITVICCVIAGCKKENLLGEIEKSKWEQDIPNYITIDSSYAVPVSPSYGDIWIYISFNKNIVEQEWTTIKNIHAQYQLYTFNSPIGTLYKNIVSCSNGTCIFEPSNTYNNNNYRFQFYIEFVNGRTTALSPMYSITTPPF